MTPFLYLFYSFDALNRLETVTDHNNQVTTYGYDAVGNRASVAYPNGTITTYGYDVLNRLENLQTKDSANTVISEFTYTLYPTGHRHTITDHKGSVSSYVYDDIYRLTQETINHANLGTVINSYDYDAVGNRNSSNENGTIATYSYEANDRLSSQTQNGSTTTYTYDDNGNLISTTEDAKVTSNSYDARNKLISVDVTASGLPISSLSFAYDTDGNRISKTQDGNQTNFVVDKNQAYAQVIHETDGNNQTQVTYTFGDDLISQDRAAIVNYYNYDGLGSTRSLTDSLGQITDSYDYNAYGAVLDQAGNSENSYLFTGEQYDAATKQYYLRARYYDPGNGRFTQMDTYQGRMGEPVTLHKYLYGNVNPVINIDPSGYFSIGSIVNGINGAARLIVSSTANYVSAAASATARIAANSKFLLVRNFTINVNRIANSGRRVVNTGEAVRIAIRGFKKFTRSRAFKRKVGRHYIDIWGPSGLDTPKRKIRGNYRRIAGKFYWRKNKQGGPGRVFMIEYKIGLNGLPEKGTGFQFRLDYQDYTTMPGKFRPHYHLCFGDGTRCKDHHYL